MFKVDIPGTDSKNKPINYWQLMDLLPNAKYDIKLDEVKELSKKFCIPPGADPKKYMRIRIEFYTAVSSGKKFAKILPNEMYLKYKNSPEYSTMRSLCKEMLPKEMVEACQLHEGHIAKREFSPDGSFQTLGLEIVHETAASAIFKRDISTLAFSIDGSLKTEGNEMAVSDE